jgi:DNA-binding transcriptional ArsR family regulator
VGHEHGLDRVLTSARTITKAPTAPAVGAFVRPGARQVLCNTMRMNAGSKVPALALDSPYVDLAVEVFAMLADATRVRIVLALGAGELRVGDLAHLVGKSPTAVSQHLAKLRLARMVTTRQDGTRVFYQLVDEHARQLVSDAVSQAEHTVDAHPRHHQAADRS